jgi:hypothetical protein
LPVLFLEKYQSNPDEFTDISDALQELEEFDNAPPDDTLSENAPLVDEDDPVTRIRKKIMATVEGQFEKFISEFDVLVGVGHSSELGGTFDASLVIIDEATQVLEVESLAIMGFYPFAQFIFAGDNRQLNPWTRMTAFFGGTMMKPMNTEVKFDDSLKSKDEIATEPDNQWFEQLRLSLQTRLSLGTEFPVFLLTEQHRCTAPIRKVWGTCGYESRIAEAVSNVKSQDEQAKIFLDFTQNTLLVPDCKGVVLLDVRNSRTDSAQSTMSSFNKVFADTGLVVVKMLISRGIKAKDIAIITPYKGQMNHYIESIKQKVKNAHSRDEEELWKSISDTSDTNIKTVDGSQGYENSITIIDLTAGIPSKKASFIGEKHLLNVAISRAQHGLVIIGDGELQVRKDMDWTAKLGEKTNWFWANYMMAMWLTQNYANCRKQIDAANSVEVSSFFVN